MSINKANCCVVVVVGRNANQNNYLKDVLLACFFFYTGYNVHDIRACSICTAHKEHSSGFPI